MMRGKLTGHGLISTKGLESHIWILNIIICSVLNKYCSEDQTSRGYSSLNLNHVQAVV